MYYNKIVAGQILLKNKTTKIFQEELVKSLRDVGERKSRMALGYQILQ